MRVIVLISMAIVAIYRSIGLTYVIERTDRYQDSRPADALLLYFLTEALIFALPLWCLLWLVGIIGRWWLVGGSVILGLCPPLLTMAYMEGDRWWHKR